jgi:hypothetical protein
VNETSRAHFIRDHQLLVIVFMVAVGFTVWGVVFWRAHTTTSVANRLCGAIKVLIQPQVADAHTKGTVAYNYYLKHPKDLKRLDDFERQLPC